MFGGGGGLDPRKMQQMMEQMGVDFEELAVEEAVLELSDGSTLHFDGPDVNKIVAQGQETYQVVGEPEMTEGAAVGEASDTLSVSAESDDDSDGEEQMVEVPPEDVEIVATRTGKPEDVAREALLAEDGDLAAAVERLE